MTVTQRIAAASETAIVPEFAPPLHPGCDFTAFNSGSPEIEVCEFLYSLVRLIKPARVLETGTHFGFSAAYMGCALSENERGELTTLEVQPEYGILARSLFANLKLEDRVQCVLQASLDYVYPDEDPIDFLFLDSEPEFRFDEFVRFWSHVRPGGFIGIHDLHPHLGHSGVVTDGMLDRPYGNFIPKLGPMILQHEVQTVTFPTPRGFTLFQKAAPDFGATNLLCGKL